MNTNLLLTNKDWLANAAQKLRVAGIKSADLDAIIILCFCIGLTKIEVLSSPNSTLPENKIKFADKLLDLRARNYPIAYITHTIEFYNRSFYIDRHVLVPRPESESFINLLKTENISDLRYLTDLGCGSGVLGITAKLEFPFLNVELLDISKDALRVSKLNLSNLKLQAQTKLSNLLASSNNKFDIILANLPYVPDTMTVNSAVLFEPKMAVFTQDNGLYLYKKMLNHLSTLDHKPKLILIECLDHQKSILRNLFNELSYTHIKSEGLVHMFICASKKTHYQ